MIGDAEVLLDAQHAPRPQRSTRDSDALPSLDGRIQALEFQGPGTRPHGRACPRIAPPARDEDVERLRPQAHLRRPTSPGRAARAGLARLPCRSCSTWQVHGALGTALSARPQRVCWARRARCVGRHVGAAAQPRRRTARRPPPPSSGLSRRTRPGTVRPQPARPGTVARLLPRAAFLRMAAHARGRYRLGAARQTRVSVRLLLRRPSGATLPGPCGAGSPPGRPWGPRPWLSIWPVARNPAAVTSHGADQRAGPESAPPGGGSVEAATGPGPSLSLKPEKPQLRLTDRHADSDVTGGLLGCPEDMIIVSDPGRACVTVVPLGSESPGWTPGRATMIVAST